MSDKPLMDRHLLEQPLWELQLDQEKGIEADAKLFAELQEAREKTYDDPDARDAAKAAVIRVIDATRDRLRQLHSFCVADLDVVFVTFFVEMQFHASERSKAAHDAESRLVYLAKLKRLITRRMYAFDVLYRKARLIPSTTVHFIDGEARETIREECLNALTLMAIQKGEDQKKEETK